MSETADRATSCTASPRPTAPRIESRGGLRPSAVASAWSRTRVPGFGLSVCAELLASSHPRLVHLEESCLEGPLQVVDRGEGAFDAPVFGRGERHPLTFTFDDDADRDTLHSSCGEALLHLAPQDRGHLISVEPVEDAACLLRLDQTKVEIPWVGEGVFDRMLCDLVEHHSMNRHLGLEGFGKMPGDGLALPVLVCCQVELVDPGQHLLELLDPFLPLLGHHVQRLEVVVDVDSEAGPILALGAGRDLGGRPRKVADVPHRRLDGHVRTEETGDGSSLRRGLDDYEALRHGWGELTAFDRLMSIRLVSRETVTVHHSDRRNAP